MNGDELKRLCKERNVEVFVQGGRVVLQAAKDTLTEELLVLLRAHQEELLRCFSEAQEHYCYRFTLKHGKGGGKYITNNGNIEYVRAELYAKYGDDIDFVG